MGGLVLSKKYDAACDHGRTHSQKGMVVEVVFLMAEEIVAFMSWCECLHRERIDRLIEKSPRY